MNADSSVAQVRPKKLALVCSVTLASTVGVAPFCLMLESPRLIAVLSALALIGAWFRIRSFETAATEEPGFVAFVFGTVGAMRLPAGAGIICFLLYAVVYGLLWVLGLGAERLEWDVPDPSRYAWYASAGIAALYVLLMANTSASRLATQLYPDAGGLRSAFFALMTHSARDVVMGLSVGLAGLAIYLLVVWWTDITIFTWWTNFLLTAAIGGMTARLERTGPLGRESPRETKSIQAVKRLFEACGYEAVAAPRTGQPSFDPLLVDLDLLAMGPERAYAVDVESSSTAASGVTRKAYSRVERASRFAATNLSEDLPNAAWVIGEYLRDRNSRSVPEVEPMVVVVGREATDFEKFIWTGSGIGLSEIPGDGVERILAFDDEEDVRDAARRYLGISVSKSAEAV